MPSSTEKLLPSLLDRLISDELDSENGSGSSTVYSLNDTSLGKSVKRDLENLLNTRIRCESWPSKLCELEYSLVNYGLPDYLTLNLAFEDGQQVFRHRIENTIKHCEPRLTEVKVIVLDDSEPINRVLRLRIHAKLQAEPMPEVITFDSFLEPVSSIIKLNYSYHE